MSAENHINDNEDDEDMPALEPSENNDDEDDNEDNDIDNDDDIIDNYDSEEDYEDIMKMQNTLCQLFDIVKIMDEKKTFEEKGECYTCYFADGIFAKSTCNKTWACIERRITSCIKNKESTSDTDQLTFIDLLHIECRTFFFAEKFDLVDLCIEHGVDINNMKFNGGTLLHNSICRGNIKQVEYLIGKNCDVTIANNVGKTPLHLVFCNCSSTALNLAKLLLNAGAVISSKDKNGVTPFDKACKYKNMFPCVYELFLDHKH